MLGYKDRSRLDTFGKRLLRLNSKLNLGTHTLTPTNYSTEKEKFLHSDTYNPQFTYESCDVSELRKEYTSLREELNSLSLPSDIHQYLSDIIESIFYDIDGINAIGTPDFADKTNQIFQFENVSGKKFLEKMNTISFNDPDSCKLKTAEEIGELFEKYLEENDIDFTVQIDYTNDHIIRVGPNKLIIGAKVKRFCNNVKRLIVHEVESHVLQRYNLNNTQSALLRLIPHKESLLWGEGLAVYNEIHSGTITKSAYETYYYRVKAVEMLHKSFRDIFEYLSKYLSAEKAYMITYRVKRGMGDTSLPGGYSKDASYALGYLTVNEYITNGGCLELLYISRVPQIGELLLEHELFESSSIKLPHYLNQSNTKPTQSTPIPTLSIPQRSPLYSAS